MMSSPQRVQPNGVPVELQLYHVDAVAIALRLNREAVEELGRQERWDYCLSGIDPEGDVHYMREALPDAVVEALDNTGRPLPAPTLTLEEAVRYREADWSAIARATGAERTEMNRRFELIQAFFEAHGIGRQRCGLRAVESFVATEDTDGAKPSARTLWRWIAAWREEGLSGLLPRRSGRCGRRPTPWSREAQRFVETAWLLPLQPSVSLVGRLARRVGYERGWTVPSDTTLALHLKSLPAERMARNREPEGDKAAAVLAELRGDEKTAWVVDLVEREMEV